MIPDTWLRVLWMGTIAYLLGMMFGMSSAWADYESPKAGWYGNHPNNSSTLFGSASAACTAIGAGVTLQSLDPGGWNGMCGDGASYSSAVHAAPVTPCADSSTPYANPQNDPNTKYYCTGTAPPSADCSQGKPNNFSTAPGVSAPNTVCHSGCIVKWDMSITTSATASNAARQWHSATNTGETCAQQPSVPDVGGLTPPAPTACPVGQCPGTVQGLDVCLKCGAPGAGPTTTTTTNTTVNPDGTSTETVVKRETTPGPGGGSSTTTTTTTTHKDGNGNVTGTGTTTSTRARAPGEGPMDDFCRTNPTSPMCMGSSFGGTCGASFTCEGDAVQCAIAKEQHQRNCKFFEETNALTDTANAILAGEDAASHPRHPSQVEQSTVAGLLERGRLLSASCPADYSFTYQGRSVTIPFSNYCTPMQWLGVLAVALSLLAGARIALS